MTRVGKTLAERDAHVLVTGHRRKSAGAKAAADYTYSAKLREIFGAIDLQNKERTETMIEMDKMPLGRRSASGSPLKVNVG
jgi:hypothetical protein